MSENDNTEIDISYRSILEAFTQSESWATFQNSIGKKAHFLTGGNWSAVCIEQKVPTGIYWLLPYGPYAQNKVALKEAIKIVSEEAKKAGCLWVRIEPRLQDFEHIKGIKHSPTVVEPANTTMLDLRADETTLYSNLAKTNRQRVNKQKRDAALTLWTSTNPSDIKSFINMQNIVSKRTGAVFHDDSYLLKQAEILMPLGDMRLEFAGLIHGEPVAGTIIHDYGVTSTYTYAASLPEARELGAANLLIWQSMINAKARGMHTFDFWGIAPPGASPNHPWQGFTGFKRSFGTKDIAFAGTWDIPLSSQYHLYRKRSQTLHKIHAIKQHIKNINKKSYK
jgi:lipid II:glycine glycyltransferase (peptidoglycan interpeptide bridge formation enzyme)